MLIRVAAAGVNRADLLQRQGHYPPPAGASEILGMEVAGEIVARGPGAVTRWKIGDKVCALVPGGGYAEYCVAHSGCCLPVPESMAIEAAASLPEATFTVWANLFDPRRLFAGDRFLMQGGTSGIGTMAIQVAKAFGATVAATAGSAEKCRFSAGAGLRARLELPGGRLGRRCVGVVGERRRGCHPGHGRRRDSMSDKRQKTRLRLAFGEESRSEAPMAPGGGTETPTAKRMNESPANNDEQLMEAVCERENCLRVYKRVKSNKGSPGIDGMTVEELPGYLKEHWPAIREQLLCGTYKPQPVKRVEIPKPDGGVRKLGIPTVLDRMVQQAVMQVLQDRWDAGFSDKRVLKLIRAFLRRA